MKLIIAGGGTGATVNCHSSGEVISVRRLFMFISLARQPIQTVLMVKPAQHGLLVDSSVVRQSMSPTLRVKEPISTVRNTRSKRRMRAGQVVMANPLAQQSPQMPLAERDQVIEALSPDRAH